MRGYGTHPGESIALATKLEGSAEENEKAHLRARSCGTPMGMPPTLLRNGARGGLSVLQKPSAKLTGTFFCSIIPEMNVLKGLTVSYGRWRGKKDGNWSVADCGEIGVSRWAGPGTGQSAVACTSCG